MPVMQKIKQVHRQVSVRAGSARIGAGTGTGARGKTLPESLGDVRLPGALITEASAGAFAACARPPSIDRTPDEFLGGVQLDLAGEGEQ